MERTDRQHAELQCHTNMSRYDGVSSATEIVNRAYELGLTAIAITDHGNINAFSEACEARRKLLESEDLKRKNQGLPEIEDKDFMKVIYGAEIYLVDDLEPIFYGAEEKEIDGTDYVVLDIETTGFSRIRDKITKVEAVKIRKGVIVEKFSTLVNPQVKISDYVENLAGISNDMVENSPLFENIVPTLLTFCKDSVLVADGYFTMDFLTENIKEFCSNKYLWLNYVNLTRLLAPYQNSYRDENIAKVLNLFPEQDINEIDDIEIIANIFLALISKMKSIKIKTLNQINEYTIGNSSYINSLPCVHASVLVRNGEGMENLYTLIKESHMHYINKRPNVPKSLLVKYKSGLIIGSSCEGGSFNTRDANRKIA